MQILNNVFASISVSEQMAFIDKYHKFLEKYRIVVIIFWIILLGFGIWLGPRLLDETSSDFDAPEDSPSAIAEKILVEDFQTFANQTSIVVIFRSVIENESVINNETRNLYDTLIEEVNLFENSEIILSILGYYSFLDIGYDEAAEQFVSPEGKSLLLIIEIEYENNKELGVAFIEHLRESINSLEYSDEELSILMTGFVVMYLEMREAAVQDMTRMDMIVIPLAMVVLAFFLRSLRLMILPIISMALSVLTSFLIIYPIALVLNVFAFVPSIVMSLVIALSIDYSLFLLSRFREEILKRKSVSESVKLMNEHAGHTITVSGLTLAVTFLGLIFFPLELLSTIGLGAAITIIVTLAVNLTLTPALLLTFTKFFQKFSLYRKLVKSEPQTKEEADKKELEQQFKSIWFKVGKFSTRFAPFVIIAIVVIAIPVSIQVFKFERSIDFQQLLPRGSDSREGYIAMSNDFNPGQVLPHYLLISTNQTNGIMSEQFFNQTKTVLTRIVTETDVVNESYVSIMHLGGIVLSYDLASMILQSNYTGFLDNATVELYRTIFNRYTNHDNSSTIIEIQTPFDPWGDMAEGWIKQTRAILDEYQDEGFELHLAEGSTFMVDAIDEVYEYFPLMMIITMCVVYVLIAIMFRSVFIPLRLILTIGLTLSWIYGLSVLVFETSAFHGISPALREVSALYWITPIMAFSILIGLGLDYDIFLLSRISEFRNRGFTEKASIHKGLFKTGNIITAAGIIMAIAFSGLLLAREMVLIQFGFLLCIAVIIDTFVIRTILVPAIMSIAEKWNWWPAKKPEPTKDENDIE